MQQLMLHHESIGYNVIDEKRPIQGAQNQDLVYFIDIIRKISFYSIIGVRILNPFVRFRADLWR